MSSSPPLPQLTAHLGFWLRHVSNHVAYAFSRKLEAQGVTVAEWAVLRELYDEEAIAPSLLAAKLGLTRGAVSKLADRLLVKALVAREANQNDGRAHTLALTPAGRDLVPVLAALADENDAQFFDHLTPEERESIEATLREVVETRGLKSIAID